MKTRYKYINFYQRANDPKRWVCNTNKFKEIIGEVILSPQYGEYVFNLGHESPMLHKYHEDIRSFLQQLNSGAKP